MSSPFVHLHTHSICSMMESTIKVKDLIEKTKKLGQEAIAITNTHNVYDAVAFYKEAIDNDIKPILGCEFAVCQDISVKDKGYDSLTVLAMDNQGWTNIKLLNTKGNKDGFYYVPRIDYNVLKEYGEGLIVLSGDMNGKLCKLLSESKIVEAENFCKDMINTFGDRFYIEIMDLGVPGQDVVNKYLREIAFRLNIPIVATNDVHYLSRSDSYAHEVMLAIGAHKKMSQPTRAESFKGRPIYPSNDFYLKDYDEMKDHFSDSELFTTLEIAERCNVSIDFDTLRMPKYPKLPEGMSAYNYLREKIYEGFDSRGISLKNKVYTDRIKEELSDIKEAELADYFLIVWDWIQWAKTQDIMVGPGRGSAGGSLVAYCLEITKIDPIQYGLIWSRFYNIGRKGSMPDIDSDLEIERREEVINYVRDTFGHDKVVQMLTFNTLGTKDVLKNVGKVFDIDFEEMNAITKTIPHKVKNLTDALNQSDKLAEYEKQYKKIFTLAKQLEGVVKSRGSHAAAVLITDKNISTGCIPLCYDVKKDKMITAFDMYTLDNLNYLKLDLLGLKTLSMMKTIQNMVGGLDVDNIPLDDQDTYDLLSQGRTYGVFQLESHLGKSWSKKIAPRSIEEVADLVSLIRTGPLDAGMTKQYAEVKNGLAVASYVDYSLEEILKETYGALVYQEQVIKIAIIFAGFDSKEADKLRKAMGKKLPEEMEKLEEQFINGAVENGHKEEIAKEIFSWINEFSGYGFNKSHAVCYSTLAYQTAYLKCHYMREFYTSALRYSGSAQKPQEEIEAIINDAKLYGIHILPPLLEKGNLDFEIYKKNIPFGIKHIKGVGESSLKNLDELKVCKTFNEYIFKCFSDKYSINKTTALALINCGATRTFDGNKAISRSMQSALYNIVIGLSNKEKAILLEKLKGKDERSINKIVITDVHEGAMKNRKPKIEKLCVSYQSQDKTDTMEAILAYEKYYLGTTISGSLADLYSQDRVTHSCMECNILDPKKFVNLGVIINKVREVKTRKGKNPGQLMCFLSVSDYSYMLESVVVFPDLYETYKDLLFEGNAVLISAETSKDGSLIVKGIKKL